MYCSVYFGGISIPKYIEMSIPSSREQHNLSFRLYECGTYVHVQLFGDVADNESFIFRLQ